MALCSSHTVDYRFTAAALLFDAALYILIRYNHAMEVNNREKVITKKKRRQRRNIRTRNNSINMKAIQLNCLVMLLFSFDVFHFP
jgi:hypothetical protein